jgi:hypothetical protein
MLLHQLMERYQWSFLANLWAVYLSLVDVPSVTARHPGIMCLMNWRSA